MLRYFRSQVLPSVRVVQVLRGIRAFRVVPGGREFRELRRFRYIRPIRVLLGVLAPQADHFSRHFRGIRELRLLLGLLSFREDRLDPVLLFGPWARLGLRDPENRGFRGVPADLGVLVSPGNYRIG